MKAGIIGSGMVGRVLATAFLNEGYEVMLGTRNTGKEEVVGWTKSNPGGYSSSNRLPGANCFARLAPIARACLSRVP